MLRYTQKRSASGLEVRFLRLFDGLLLMKRQVQFQSDGISIVTRIFGVPINHKWFDRSQIYGFGYAVHGHSHARLLQFNYAGEGEIVLAKDVLQVEVTAFLKHLYQEGFHYNTSWQRPLKDFGFTVE